MAPQDGRSNQNNITAHLIAVAVLAILASLILSIRQASAQDNIPDIVPTNTYLVRFQPGYGEAERSDWIASQGAELISWMPQINVAEIRLNSAMAPASVDMAPVAYFEPDIQVSGEIAVTDPAYSDPDQGYALRMLGAADAWDVTAGSDDIIIALLDTGINFNHPEFAGRIVGGYDFVNNDADATDDHGHGTHVAGIVAAGLDGFGTVGICPHCKLMPVKVLDANNGGTWSWVTQGILYAVDHGARVINLSLGATVPSSALRNAIDYAQQHNVVVVAASGNKGQQVDFYPAAIPSVIAVSGTDRNDVRWTLSNYGNYVDVAAPAANIYSSYYDKTGTSTYAYMSGTSMATPFVSGLAGLVLSRQPDLTSVEVTDMITANAVDLGPAGKDIEYGYGRIDVYATLLAANGGVVPTPPEDDENGGAGTGITSLYLPQVTR